MSLKYRISSIGDVVVSSQTGLIQHLAEVSHEHVNDSVLYDLKNLKNSLQSGDTVKWDGSNMVVQPLGDYLTVSDASSTYATVSDLNNKADASALSSYLLASDASSTYATVSDLNNKADASSLSSYLLSSDASSTYATQTDLANKADSSALSSYLLASDASSTYATISDLNNKADASSLADYLTVSDASSTYATVSDLNNKADSSALSSYLLASDASSTYATISDLNNKADASSLDDKLNTSDLGTEVTGLNTITINEIVVGAQKSTSYKGNLQENYTTVVNLPTVSNHSYHLKVKGLYNSHDMSSVGFIEYTGTFRNVASTTTLLTNSDSVSSVVCNGSELNIVPSANQISIQVKGGSVIGWASGANYCLHVELMEC